MIRPAAVRIFVAMTVLAGLMGSAMVLIAPGRPDAGPEMVRAASIAAEAAAAVRAARGRAGVTTDADADPNRTGLIGLEWSPITTTLGALSAKRTTTNPNLAAGLVRWMRDAGVRERSVVAIGASGSFPGLIIAAVAAVQALGADPVVITSVAASTWGANDPAFTWMEMETALVGATSWPRSLAASLGGDGDAAFDLTPEARALLWSRIAAAGVAFVGGETLRGRIAWRMAAYERAAGSRPVAVFVNIGGASANVGTCAEVLRLRPGVHWILPRCSGEPGVMWIMHERGVPVIHLLHVDGIAASLGLPIDPVPLPVPGWGAPFTRPSRRAAAGLLAVYLAALIPLTRRARAVHPAYRFTT